MLIFILPILLVCISVIIWDPFKVFFSYIDYYTGNKITGNREQVCYDLFEKQIPKGKIRNFIVGSSRSEAYKTNYWAKCISAPENTCFHFDGSGYGLFRANNAIKFLSAHTEKIDNLLLIVDPEFLAETTNPQDHLFIHPPAISGESKLAYYWIFLKASLDIEFIFDNLIYNITGKYYNFMGHHISSSKNSFISNNATADIWYGYDKDILKDSVGYYQKLLREAGLDKRSPIQKYSDVIIKNEQIRLLSEIKACVLKSNISIKIVISPLLNQLKVNEKDYAVLCGLFGKDNVYDFSGINKYTADRRNYYDKSHYKPYIANDILNQIYKRKL